MLIKSALTVVLIGIAMLMACLALGGCAVVTVYAPGEKPKLSVWPMGVNIERRGDAIDVHQIAVGPSFTCGAAVIGVSYNRCMLVRPDANVAIFERPNDFLERKLP